MASGLLWAALSGGAQAGIDSADKKLKAQADAQAGYSLWQAKRVDLLAEMEAKSRWAQQADNDARAAKTGAINERLSAGAGEALAQRYASPQAGDTPLTTEQQEAQAQGLERQQQAMGRDRAAYERDPQNRLRASTEAGFTDPAVMAQLDSRSDLAQSRLEAQAQATQARTQADAEKHLSKIELAMAKLDAQRQARPPAGYRETPGGDLEAIPGGPADQKRTGAYNADTAQLAGSTDGLNRLSSSASAMLNHPGLPGIVGLRGKLPNIPGTDAADAAAQLETLKSQIGFGVLQAMRDSSKTGGALGAVSDAEGKRLEANLAALSQAQSLEQFKASLQEIVSYTEGAKGRLRDSYNLKHGDGERGEQSAPPPSSASRPPRIGSRAELDALPSGTTFTAPDGSLRRKP